MIDRTIKKGDLVEFDADFVYTEGELGIVVQISAYAPGHVGQWMAEILWHWGAVSWERVENLCVPGDPQSVVMAP